MHYINNWLTTLLDRLQVGAQSMALPTEAVTRLGLGDGREYLVTLTASLDPLQQAAFEIVKITGGAGSTVQIVRAQEGTTAANWPAGTYAYVAVTAGALISLQAALASAQQTIAAQQQALTSLTNRVEALEQGGGGVDGELVDDDGNTLTDDEGNTLIGDA